jgi:hypothetical protein
MRVQSRNAEAGPYGWYGCAADAVSYVTSQICTSGYRPAGGTSSEPACDTWEQFQNGIQYPLGVP